MPYQSPALQRGAPLFYQLAGLEVMAHVLATVVMAQGQPGQPQPHRSPSATGRPEPPHTLSTWAKSPLLSLRSHIFSVEYLPRPTRSSDSLAGLVTVLRHHHHLLQHHPSLPVGQRNRVPLERPLNYLNGSGPWGPGQDHPAQRPTAAYHPRRSVTLGLAPIAASTRSYLYP